MHLKEVLGIFLLAVILFLPLVTAHTGPAISYQTIVINDSNVHFVNTNEGNSYFILAAQSAERDQIINAVQVTNAGETCPLTGFINQSNLAAPYFFTAACANVVTRLGVEDAFFAKASVGKVYNVHAGNMTYTFLGNESTNQNNGTLLFTVDVSAAGAPTASSHSYQGVPKSTLFFRYLNLGVQHILSGPDHLFFIIGFIVLSTSLPGLLKGISGFTVSHSATLTLAALGFLLLPARVVEPMIALSIVVVGLLSLSKKNTNWFVHFGVIFGFGLFHGLGFAGSIADVGFPKNGFLTTLLGFTLGIEVGQLLVVGIVYPLLAYLEQTYPTVAPRIRTGISSIVILGGTFWLLQRVVGF